MSIAELTPPRLIFLFGWQLLLYILPLSTPRLEGQFNPSRLEKCASITDNLVLVTLRYGKTAQPLIGGKSVVPAATDVLEFLHMDGSLARSSDMNQKSSQRLYESVAKLCPEAVVPAQVLPKPDRPGWMEQFLCNINTMFVCA